MFSDGYGDVRLEWMSDRTLRTWSPARDVDGLSVPGPHEVRVEVVGPKRHPAGS